MIERGIESDPHKRCLYFPEEMLEEIRAEALRLDRSLSWVVQHAWKLSRAGIMGIATYDDVVRSSPDDSPIAPRAHSTRP